MNRFSGVYEKVAYSETTFFYNPGRKLPNGVYFLTIKEDDGPNDKSSRLKRDGVFRLSFKPDPKEYARKFGDKPARPAQAVPSIWTTTSREKMRRCRMLSMHGWVGP